MMRHPSHDPVFAAPPSQNNTEGRRRTVGFEIEFGDLNALGASRIVRQAFGGAIVEIIPERFKVTDTALGEFSIKLDTRIGADRQLWRKPLQAELLKATRKAMSALLPHEIVTPPVPIDRIAELDA